MTHAHRRAAAGGGAALAALLLAAPPPRAAAASLSVAGSSADPTGPLVAAVALLAWAVTGWLVLTVVVVLLSRLPGLLGRTAGALARRVAPATVRRTVEAALGLTVVAGALTPAAAVAAPAAGPSPAVVLGAETAWDLDWPSRSRAAPPSLSPVTRTTPAPVGPRSTTSPPARPPAVRPPAASAPAPQPAAAAPRAAVRPSPAGPSAGAVVVRAGDSLWSLAEASLRRTGTAAPTDRQVAQAWPRWWAANREVVGDDPDLLLPGTVLRPPGDLR